MRNTFAFGLFLAVAATVFGLFAVGPTLAEPSPKCGGSAAGVISGGSTVPVKCPDRTPTPEPDLAGPPAGNLEGRINNSESKDVAAPVALYCANDYIDIYKIIDVETAATHLVIHHPQMYGLPENGENVLLAEAEGVSLYWLASGEYQVNTLNFEGNLYSIIWEGCNPVTLVHNFN
ncbi:MAG: hypothetical protein K8F30_09215 [Taibaiella sp.]|nr:hypothetical protein [Taibaiella sp.]